MVWIFINLQAYFLAEEFMDKVSSVEHFPPALLRICNSSAHVIDFRSAMTTQWVSWQFGTTVLRLFYWACRRVLELVLLATIDSWLYFIQMFQHASELQQGRVCRGALTGIHFAVPQTELLNILVFNIQ